MFLTLQQTYNALKLQLPPYEARMVVQHVTGQGQEVFISAPETPVSEEHQTQIQQIVGRRIKGEPLNRILGVREFWGLEFEVTPDVLDPRADTETLIEATLTFARAHTKNQIRILDLGTGTGCIPIALLSELPEGTAVTVDKSAEALKVARRNALKHDEKYKMSNRIEFVESDWFSAVKGQKFDLIVSNPPYISESVIQTLNDEVKNHDPFMALSGGESGLDCYEIILSHLKDHLNEGGRAFLEIGYDQLESITRLVDESNLLLCAVYKDLAGNDRVVEISKRPSGDN